MFCAKGWVFLYLKRIELYGFKSFADRTELEFVPGVTAVVGPNGSGKSNVSDAMRWVLGEQSAKSLRGTKMEDIIFAGSDSRKPVNYGEVTLVLDNEDKALALDFAEVSVTRRVYRSGESEYFINKQPCRLKDITELFMDTGLGKEAYSIIGQGRIEEILSTKSEDRRGIFEEAAGVVKYKNRKKEAERKLDDTEGNLVRIQDIIHEVEEQLEPLKIQSEKAHTYKKLKEELTEKEISTYVYLIETLHLQWQQASDVLKELKQQEEESSTKLNQEEATFEQTKWQLSQVEEQLDDVQQQLLNVTEEVEKLEGQREVLKERKKNFSSNREEIVKKLEQLQERRHHAQFELNKETENLSDIEQEVNKLDHELKSKQSSLEQMIQHVDDRLEQLKGDYIDRLNEHASLKNEYRHLDQMIQQYKQKLQRVEHEHKQFVDERRDIQVQITEKEQEIKVINDKVIALRQSYQQQLERKKQLFHETEKLEETYRQTTSLLEQISSRRQFLIEMKDDFTGFFHGVKEVLKARNRSLQGIDGAVAELISVPKKYEIAIETALGASLQHIVVSNEQAGQQAIRYLKQRHLGRATFLPRNVLKPRIMPKHDQQFLKGAEGYIGLAYELVSYEETYSNVVSNLLGQVIVTDNIELATRLAKQLQYRYRFVTLDGDIVNPGGSMTGGSAKKSQTNLLGREREIDQLADQIEEVKVKISEQKEALSNNKRLIDACDEQMSALQQEGEQYNQVEEKHKEELSHLQFQKSRLDDRLERYDQDTDQYKRELTISIDQKKKVAQKLQEHQQTSETIEDEIKQLEVQKKENESSKEKQSEEVTQLKVLHAKNVQAYENAKQQVDRLKQSKASLDEEWEDVQQSLLNLEGDLGKQDDEETELDMTIKEKKSTKNELTLQVQKLREQRRVKQQEIEHLETNIRAIRKEHKVIEDQIHEREVKVNRLDVELDNYLTVLREEYELSFELAKQQYPLQDEYDVVKRDVDRLKRDIQSLGGVNLGAIEEYERLSHRFTFLKEQEGDLIKAKETLYEVIDEMDEEMTKRFKETFDKTREYFHDVFAQLFGGGRADLILTNPDELLTTGVDIVAQPPGKKLQHLSLLSGGERALTAIALLFAILRVRPVPFCVLDEVEAALDDANVFRYAQYLREFSKRTQFIVITHRKGTMEGADVLYGVTMQESGVSKLVSVRLEERETIETA